MAAEPDPQPDRTPGLEPGGGVPPGETPPESASATTGLAHREPKPSRTAPSLSAVLVTLAVLMVLVVVIALVTGVIRTL